MGYMTQPTVSKHWRKTTLHICSMKKKSTQNTQT